MILGLRTLAFWIFKGKTQHGSDESSKVKDLMIVDREV